MANMREIRERISSIEQILKITNAMYLISSSKLKKVRKNLEATEPYFHKLQTTLDDILDHTPSRSIAHDDIRPKARRLIVPLALKAERARAERGEQDAHHDREHRDICELLRDRCHRIYSSLFAKNWKYPHSKLCLPRRKDTFPPQPQSLAFLSSTFFS